MRKYRGIISYAIFTILLVGAMLFIFRKSDTYYGRDFNISEDSESKKTTSDDETSDDATSNNGTTENGTTENGTTENGTSEDGTTDGDTTQSESNSGASNSTEQTNGSENETTTKEPVTQPPTTEEPTTDESLLYDYYYKDNDVRIAITEVEDDRNNQKYYVADVQLSSIDYLLSVFAYGAYSTSSRQGTKAMAKSVGAIFAVSGDYYNQRSGSIVIRNGVLYRNTHVECDMLIMDSEGDMSIIPAGEPADGNALLAAGIINTWRFGPAIVENGKAVSEVRATSSYIKGIQPRMLIGQVDKLHYLFVAVDGRDDDSVGMTIYECADLMESLGCEVAYNLDGGGTATMVFDGQIVNTPSQGSERSISDCIAILRGDD